MKSSHVDLYNHDEDAPDYDQDVLQSDDPIREGYQRVLDWVVEQAQVTSTSTVVELGSGTANLTFQIPVCRSLKCVDISSEMTRIAKGKLGNRSYVSFIQSDLLEYFDRDASTFDIVLSTYAIHHLTEEEKRILFGHLAARLNPGGRAVFGDLMVENSQVEADLIKRFRSNGDPTTAEALDEEFFWHIEPRLKDLSTLGFTTRVERFSTLSWGIIAEKN